MKQTPIQEKIEARVTNGLGYDDCFSQDHKGSYNLEFHLGFLELRKAAMQKDYKKAADLAVELLLELEVDLRNQRKYPDEVLSLSSTSKLPVGYEK